MTRTSLPTKPPRDPAKAQPPEPSFFTPHVSGAIRNPAMLCCPITNETRLAAPEAVVVVRDAHAGR
jgi:hypothetical protein